MAEAEVKQETKAAAAPPPPPMSFNVAGEGTTTTNRIVIKLSSPPPPGSGTEDDEEDVEEEEEEEDEEEDDDGDESDGSASVATFADGKKKRSKSPAAAAATSATSATKKKRGRPCNAKKDYSKRFTREETLRLVKFFNDWQIRENRSLSEFAFWQPIADNLLELARDMDFKIDRIHSKINSECSTTKAKAASAQVRAEIERHIADQLRAEVPPLLDASHFEPRHWAAVGNRAGYLAKYCCQVAGFSLPSSMGRKRKAPPATATTDGPTEGEGRATRTTHNAAAAAAAAASSSSSSSSSAAKRQHIADLLAPLVREGAYMDRAAAILPQAQQQQQQQVPLARVFPPPPIQLSWKIDAMHHAVFDVRDAPLVRITFLPGRAVELTSRMVTDVAKLVHAGRPAADVLALATSHLRTMSGWPLCSQRDADENAALLLGKEDKRLFQLAYYLEAFYNSIVHVWSSSSQNPEVATALATLQRTYQQLAQAQPK